MRQVLQDLRNGQINLENTPWPTVAPGEVLIKARHSLISTGTERMLLEFGRAGWLDKARQQPEKVKMVLDKIKVDGLVPTVLES